MDCMDSLNLNFNELQLMRLEYRPPLAIDIGPAQEDLQKFHSQLLLGAEGPQAGNRPTYYQVPLLSSQTESCSFCRVLYKSSAMSPPQLPGAQRLYLPHADLNGHWMSLRCEVHPYGLFLIRIFIFSSKDSSWQFRHLYYRDAKCQNPMFILSAKGSYKVGKPSDIILDAVEYEFHVSESFLTPEDMQFVNNLIGLRSCGSSSNWKINQMVNITAFGGCKELGITVPSTEKDLVRFEGREPDFTFLYLGEASEDHRRPTSFQPALMRCTSLNVADDDDFLLNYNHLR
ncbi:Protein APCDD1, partial [Stegodyphus mimosarum]